jgi:16S rRNA U516 pseudouridylate synthase RsuA-like enzyme
MSYLILSFLLSHCLSQAHKLRGEIVAHQDPLNRPMMLTRYKQIIPEISDLKPINKLEINTEGLQLLTNSPLLVKTAPYPSHHLH